MRATTENPVGAHALLQLGLRDGLGYNELALGVLMLAMLLGYCAYTDAFRGRIIRNAVTGGLLVGSIAVVPLLYNDPLAHMKSVGAAALIFFVVFWTGAIKEGDFKLYIGLAVLLGKAAILLAFVSWILMVTYSAPAMWAASRKRKAAGEKLSKQNMTTAPAGPSIAAAFPVSLLLARVITFPQALILLAAAALTVAGSYWLRRLDDAAEAKRLAEEAAAADPAAKN